MPIRSLILSAALCLVGFSAMADDVVLCSGKSGGKYDSLTKSIGLELERQGHSVTILNLGGSEDILNNLNAGKCMYGPAQRDIHYLKSKSDGSFMTSVPPVAILFNEVPTMVCTEASGYDELSDIKEGDRIIVDTIGSGSALTWETIVSIEKEFGNGSSWASAIPEFIPLDEAEATMGLGGVKCAFGVSGIPATWAKTMEQNGNTISWVYDKDINDLEVNGVSLYEPVRIHKSTEGYSSKFDSYKIPAILFKSSKMKASPAVESIIKRVAPSIGSKFNTVK